MGRLTSTFLLALLSLTVLSSFLTPAEAQRKHGKHGERPPAAADGEQDRAGKYGFGHPEILEAIDRGEGRQALAAYEQAAREAEARGAVDTAIRAGEAAAYTARRLGLLQQALSLGRHAIELARAQPPASLAGQRAVLSAYTVVGRAYYAAGDTAQARRFLEDALAAARLGEGRKHQRGTLNTVAGILTALADVAAREGDRPAALAYTRESARTLESIDLGHVSDRARTGIRRQAAGVNLQLARLALADRRLDEAAAALGRASQYARLVGLANLDAKILVVGAQVALERNDAPEALRLLTRGRAAAERVGESGLLVEYDRTVARVSEKLGQVDDALAATQRALGRLEGTRREFQDSALRASFLDQRQGLYYRAVHLALRAGKPEEAFALAERSRARAFLDLLGQRALLSKGPTGALAAEETRLRAQLQETAAQAGADEPEEESAPSLPARLRVIAVEREYRAFVDRVRKDNGEQASLMAVEPVTLAEIQALLPEGTTLLEYLVTEGDVVLWVVDRARVEVRRGAGGRAALARDVRDFRTAIADQAPLPEIETRARALYRRLLAPARPAIRGSRLLIVPHDVLHYLPFGALRTPDGRWLMEDYALGTVPSASVLKFLADKGAHASDRILAVGNPDLGPGSALRYAERETQAIAERFPATTTVLTRAEATEARARRLATGAGLLHFAVHGDLNENDPMGSALLLAPGEGEDGRLEVRELFTLDLAARLVVLSACESGLGKLSRGDELVGLQRAFLYAGTPAVVTTLWKIDDRASYLLMRSFYEHLAAKGPAEALRAAQRALLVDFPHPFAWAAFGLTGTPR